MGCAALVISTASLHADEYQWLEDVEGSESLAWVEQQNARSLPRIMANPDYQQLYQNSLEVFNSRARIPAIAKRGDYLYNFWQDGEHVKGIYRRTTLAEYSKPEPQWETILDVDALAAEEGVNWNYSGMNCLHPAYEKCLLSLSIGGADATVIREFSLREKAFVESGFQLAEAKSRISWLDEDTLLVGTDFGVDSMTSSGYPRMMKRWRWGTSLQDAESLYTAPAQSVSVSAYTLRDDQHAYAMVSESLSFYTSAQHVYQDGELIRLPIPLDADIAGLFQNNLFIELKSDWEEFQQGSIIHAPMQDVIRDQAQFELFVAPGPRTAISALNFTRASVLVTWLDNVRKRLEKYTLVDGQWQHQAVDFDPNGALQVQNTDYLSDDFFVSYTGFTEPPSLYWLDGQSLEKQQLKSMPAMFDSEGLVTQQYMARSADGTQIPYFVVMPEDIVLDGSNPTLLYGYGGFEISYGPSYSASMGRNWLARGGVYVLANIRGGGEFGPQWHQAALLKNRHKAYEDFEAVAEDLISRRITSSRHLGIRGGSNGGLLVGAAFTRRPELFNAVVCQVPLLDMQRYSKLLAGASWMGEYGDPDDPEMWEYIQSYSPYHNVDAETEYPQVFFTTSTRDDRVHPGHARKMVARMNDLGHDVLYYENTEGGHAGAADNRQRARLEALIYSYLHQRLR